MKRLFYLVSSAVICIVIIYFLLRSLQTELPDVKQLQHVTYQTPLKIYSSDGLLLAQFGEKKRTPVSINKVPQQLVNAFLAAEDGSFYSHSGVDYKGLIRAFYQLLLTGKKQQGGSTITMQVARNYLLSREKTYTRKIKEIILALQIENEYSKDKILELYLNKIYLGHRSYGVVAASSTYYGKKLSALDISQLAMIAGLPKSPSQSNPITNPKRAVQRRNYVLRRMKELDYISKIDFDNAVNKPLTSSLHSAHTEASAPYISEMVRKEIVNKYGEKAYTSGLNVHTTIVSPLQLAATHAVHSGLHLYDRRHGYRSLPHQNKARFDNSEFITIADTQSAQIVDIKQEFAIAKLKDNSLIKLSFENLKWARKFKSRNNLGPELKSITDIVKINDLVKVRQLDDKSWSLAQIPEPEAAFVALNSKNGAILALSGGFDFYYNEYNRAVQSKRQPGSGFKPIIYTTALENGYTVASVINDAPVVIDSPNMESEWRPENYSKKFLGLTRLRTALRKSKNLISIRLLRKLGIQKVIDTAKRFGFTEDQLPDSLSLALGSGYATPVQMATVFSVFANGGFLVKPYFIERIEDDKGNIVFESSPDIACPLCENELLQVAGAGYATRIISPQINFLMNSLLRDVVQRGTATKAKVLGRTDLAGKTGTTNDQRDTWFNGFSSGIAATAWLGFDSAKSLGRKETGGMTALPIWTEFMKTALKDKPIQTLEKPEGIVSAFIDPKTGLLDRRGSKGGFLEYFQKDYAPSQYSPIEVELGAQEESEEESLF